MKASKRNLTNAERKAAKRQAVARGTFKSKYGQKLERWRGAEEDDKPAAVPPSMKITSR